MSLELERSALEELQTIENAITHRLQRNPELYDGYLQDAKSNLSSKKKRSFREVLLQQHEISKFLEQYKKQKVFVQESLKDQVIRSEELKALKDPTLELKRFDELYQGIKNSDNETIVKNLGSIYSMKSSKVGVLSEIAGELDLSLMFSGEEYFGKYLDLVSFHERWLNLSEDKNVSYVKYLDLFDKFESVKVKKNDEYSKYLVGLSDYLQGFIKRATPLFDLESLLKKVDQEFKEEKRSNELYCDACEKEFAKKTVYDGHLTGKKHIKNAQKKNQQPSAPGSGVAATKASSNKNVECYEYLIKELVKPLATKRQDTKLNTERRKALTERERIIEIAQLEKDEVLSDSDESSKEETEENSDFKDGVYNPMNLPLGFDGQPIPYWLWKLHGLGIEYNCEICGNFAYKGRKAFEKHFLEPRHIHGLKCLGITPSAVFKDITNIKEASDLWAKVKKERKVEEGEKENAIEVEDDEGNVMSEKIYNDLKKQGLI